MKNHHVDVVPLNLYLLLFLYKIIYFTWFTVNDPWVILDTHSQINTSYYFNKQPLQDVNFA